MLLGPAQELGERVSASRGRRLARTSPRWQCGTTVEGRGRSEGRHPAIETSRLFLNGPLGATPVSPCYTRLMPTTRKRHIITETDPIAQALDDAAKHWPDIRDNRAKLLLQLVLSGHQVVLEQHEHDEANRRAAVTRTSGICTGAYDRDYLTELRKDWPQ